MTQIQNSLSKSATKEYQGSILLKNRRSDAAKHHPLYESGRQLPVLIRSFHQFLFYPPIFYREVHDAEEWIEKLF